MANTKDSISSILAVQTNKNQARLTLAWSNPKFSDEPIDAARAHGSGDPVSATRRSRRTRVRRAKSQFIGEQLMSGDASTAFNRGEMSHVDPRLPLQPLPDEPLGDADSLGQGGLPSSNLNSSLNRLLSHNAETSRASRRFQELGSWRSAGSATSLALMSKKRPLTEDEKKAAALILQTIEGGTKTQDEIASEAGVSQGMIWQWMNARSPVPAKRAQKLATALGLHPSQVSVAWRSVVRDAKKLAWPFPKVDPQRWADLTPGQKIRIEGLVLGEIVDIERKRNESATPARKAQKT
jgi:transcriptional regulator with XRE-family HTH domain